LIPDLGFLIFDFAASPDVLGPSLFFQSQIRNPKSQIGWRVVRVFKLPSWSGGVAAASADGVVLSSIQNLKSKNLKSKIG
jgi:hypothetical protein